MGEDFGKRSYLADFWLCSITKCHTRELSKAIVLLFINITSSRYILVVGWIWRSGDCHGAGTCINSQVMCLIFSHGCTVYIKYNKLYFLDTCRALQCTTPPNCLQYFEYFFVYTNILFLWNTPVNTYCVLPWFCDLYLYLSVYMYTGLWLNTWYTGLFRIIQAPVFVPTW